MKPGQEKLREEKRLLSLRAGVTLVIGTRRATT
jgi:hypothetical protein